MKYTFDDAVNKHLYEAVNPNVVSPNIYQPTDTVDCPYKLNDTLQHVGIATPNTDMEQNFQKYKGKKMSDVINTLKPQTNPNQRTGQTPPTTPPAPSSTPNTPNNTQH